MNTLGWIRAIRVVTVPLLLLLAVPCHADQPTSVVSYVLSARLDELTHRVHGNGTITWTNTSVTPAQELYLHAYLNAFAGQRSLFLRPQSGASRSQRPLYRAGRLVIHELRARELQQVDLLKSVNPNGSGDGDDATDLLIPLPQPVAPGATLNLDVVFTAELPNLVERSGSVGTFHAVAQWFPKLARREPDGTWRHFAYHPLAEFYADFGDYEVTLDVPAAYRVGATGTLVSSRLVGKRRIDRYRAQGVHDFAWFADSNLLTLQDSQGDTKLHLLFPPEQHGNIKASLPVLKFGLGHFERLYGDYPYRQLTLVHPPDVARPAAGMEYPQLITTGGAFYLPYTGAREVPAVVLHELAHQWFYGLLASDETRWPVLDEGLATYAEVEALSRLYGPGSALNLGFFQVSAEALLRRWAAEHSRQGPLAIPAAHFTSFDSLSGRAYARMATLLSTVAKIYGEAALFRALGRYARDNRFSHPTPDELVSAVQAEMGAEVAEMLRTALFADGWVDYAVRRIECLPPVSGGATPSAVRCRILLERRGTLRFPVTVEIEHADGFRQRRRWDPLGTQEWLVVEHEQPVLSATVDPEHLVTLDDDLSNQTLSRDPPRVPWRVATLLTLAADLLLKGLFL